MRTHSETPRADQPADTKTVRPLRSVDYALLLLPYLGLLLPPLYARSTPVLAGIPFFYVYQFAWVFLSAGLTAVVYRRITH